MVFNTHNLPSKGDTQVNNTKYLRCSEKEQGLMGHREALKVMVIHFQSLWRTVVSFKVSLLILEERSQAALVSLQCQD